MSTKICYTRKNRINNSITKGLRTSILEYQNTQYQNIKMDFLKGSAKWLQDK